MCYVAPVVWVALQFFRWMGWGAHTSATTPAPHPSSSLSTLFSKVLSVAYGVDLRCRDWWSPLQLRNCTHVGLTYAALVAVCGSTAPAHPYGKAQFRFAMHPRVAAGASPSRSDKYTYKYLTPNPPQCSFAPDLETDAIYLHEPQESIVRDFLSDFMYIQRSNEGRGKDGNAYIIEIETKTRPRTTIKQTILRFGIQCALECRKELCSKWEIYTGL
jgi:hypothetical protein